MGSNGADQLRDSLHPELLAWMLQHMTSEEHAEFTTDLLAQLEQGLSTLRGNPTDNAVADIVTRVFQLVEDWRLSLLMIHAPGWPDTVTARLKEWSVWSGDPFRDPDRLMDEDSIRGHLGI